MKLSALLKENCRPKILDELVRIQKIHAYREKLDSLKKMLSLYETHTDRLVPPTLIMGSHLGVQGKQLRHLEEAAILHDIGKVGVPREILESSKHLDARETEIIRRHPAMGRDIIRFLGFSDVVVSAVEHHHQRYDGKGYPEPQIQGKDIPLFSRIISIMDAFDAITSDRPYHDRIEFRGGIEILNENAATQFDPDLIRLFERIEKPIREFENAVSHSKNRDASSEQMLHTNLELCKFYLSFGYCDVSHRYLAEAGNFLQNRESPENVRLLRLKGRTIYFEQGKNALSSAVEFIEKSTILAHKIEDQRGIGKAFLEILDMSVAVGEKTISTFFKDPLLKNVKDVESFFQDGLAASTSCEDFKTAAHLINQMIYLLTMRNRASDAIFLMRGQEKLIQQITHAGEITIIFYNHLGIAYQSLGKYDEAIENFDRAIEMARARVAKRELQWVLNGKGYTLLLKNQPDQAKNYFQESLQIADELMDFREITLTMTNLGQAYLREEQYEDAHRMFQKAYDLKKEQYPNMENAPEGIHGSLMLEIMLTRTGYRTGRLSGMKPLEDLEEKYRRDFEKAPHLMDTFQNFKKELVNMAKDSARSKSIPDVARA